MRKLEELSNPASCLNKATDDEWLFVLLGRDPAAAATVRFWIDERLRLRLNMPGDDKLQEAEKWAETMENLHRGPT
jgi:hypothetical protein